MEQLQGCGWADGMSFSPFAGEKTILVPILSPHDTLIPLSPSLSLPSLSRPFSPPRSVSFRGFVPCAAFIKLLFYEALGDIGWGGGRRQGGGGVLGPTWKLISNESRVKPKLIRFRLAWPAALTNLKNFGNANFSTRDWRRRDARDWREGLGCTSSFWKAFRPR